ncbi:hypothetical protein [Cecembia calidifontis]|uniref:Uncharacterized protein n=1 Tax=Cecembia calidifontis TaxID=1187080 RepID=A0A4Q7P696_9BACT|nr:hypothetical protein [Cecembia calidifontis]RZS95596.1 hypothetical protein BC751_1130 [Cecembia calidifontis]
MKKEDLKKFIEPYQKHVQKGLPGIDSKGKPVTEQSQWAFFDRATIEKLLQMTDPKTGGIKIYFGQYDSENIYLVPEDREGREQYIGRISVALSAANKESDGIYDVFLSSDSIKSGEDSIENGANLCPPFCRPPITL